MRSKLSDFRAVWAVDFEFNAPPGERPKPLCLVARELRTGQLVRQWLTDGIPNEPPYDLGSDSLFVAYYVSAELGCHLALGWPLPSCILDLYVEFRNLTNGISLPSGSGLLGALSYFGLDCLESVEKEEMRALALREGSHNASERAALLNYCQSDVDSLPRLLVAMESRIDLPRALLRGAYMRTVAAMEHRGVPIDVETLGELREHWPAIQERLIERIDSNGEVYEGRSFRAENWARYLVRNDIPWPRLESGALDLSDECFRLMARKFPKQVGKWRELRHTLGQLRLESLSVGSDGRNRCLLSPFRARSGRNQPSNSRYVFGPSAWVRSLIKPEPGRAVAYLDYGQQEWAIVARLSGDRNMQEAYLSADPYLTFAKQAGAVPEWGTKQSHKAERSLFKTCALGVQFGMGEESLAQSIGDSPAKARELLRLHRQTYPKYWKWVQGAIDHAMLYGHLDTVYGWRLHVGQQVNPRSLGNFPSQANGAEMLRLACCMLVAEGIELCAPIHDAVLIEGPSQDIGEVVKRARAIMERASEIVLDGFRVTTDCEIVSYPNRYRDERGEDMWRTVSEIKQQLTGKLTSAPLVH